MRLLVVVFAWLYDFDDIYESQHEENCRVIKFLLDHAIAFSQIVV